MEDLVFGQNGVASGEVFGKILVDHSTIHPENTRKWAARLSDEAGMCWIDAPVSGGPGGAARGELVIMAGGEIGDFETIRPALETYSRRATLMGPVGAGQLTKMVNQICIAGLLQGLSEGIHFAERAGLDATAAMEVIAQGAAQSWQMNNRAQTMIKGEFDFGFAVDWMRKDLGIAIEAAQSVGAQVPVTQLVDTFYSEVQDLGGHRWDTSSLIQRLRAGEANRE